MKKLCSDIREVQLFARYFKPSKKGGDGEKSKSAALLACAGTNG